MVEHRFVQCILVLEVVIEQRLVDVRRARDRVGPSARNSMLGKFRNRRLEDCCPALFRTTASSQTMSPQTAGASAACGTTRPTGGARSCRCFHIINQLVRFYPVESPPSTSVERATPPSNARPRPEGKTGCGRNSSRRRIGRKRRRERRQQRKRRTEDKPRKPKESKAQSATPPAP